MVSASMNILPFFGRTADEVAKLAISIARKMNALIFLVPEGESWPSC